MEPAVWGSAKAADLMGVGVPEPSHLPNLAILREAQQEIQDLELKDKDCCIFAAINIQYT